MEQLGNACQLIERKRVYYTASCMYHRDFCLNQHVGGFFNLASRRLYWLCSTILMRFKDWDWTSFTVDEIFRHIKMNYPGPAFIALTESLSK
jgi:hypothetical protein